MDLLNQMMGRADELQRSLQKAIDQKQGEWKPHVEAALQGAQSMRDKLQEQIDQGATTLGSGAKEALGHLDEMVRIGRETLDASADQARARMPQMMEHAKRTGESVKNTLEGLFKKE
ncbi:MAG TPA: hypothetical protein VNJ51_01340 [Candidatus Dormibacteraeota bacterium]|nr:hypothetical protein [Candidatus Dormibacteraeota bacterium]